MFNYIYNFLFSTCCIQNQAAKTFHIYSNLSRDDENNYEPLIEHVSDTKEPDTEENDDDLYQIKFGVFQNMEMKR